jgi:D-sedoheptulose 7-phosphate isomerase
MDLGRIAEDHVAAVQRFFSEQGETLTQAAADLVSALGSGRKLLVFGNGGSAADAQHMAAELVGRFERERRGLPAIALTVDSSAVTAIANDYGYERVFARQIEALGVPGDVALAISTSGRSPSVVEGVLAARARGLRTIGLLGRDGGPLRPLVDRALVVESTRTARIQEVHIVVIHALCEAIDTALHPPSGPST